MLHRNDLRRFRISLIEFLSVASPNLERYSIVRVRVYVAGWALHRLLFLLGFFRLFDVLVEMLVQI